MPSFSLEDEDMEARKADLVVGWFHNPHLAQPVLAKKWNAQSFLAKNWSSLWAKQFLLVVFLWWSIAAKMRISPFRRAAKKKHSRIVVQGSIDRLALVNIDEVKQPKLVGYEMEVPRCGGRTIGS
ncbi:hypothetical protein AMTR_s00040p00068730 [Amborella trichopoda]|uniref:Uncharacterized protein n=1 Tax=Amborella trichopoda TaxID=13333 RepID=W1PYF8_AMBTC|nr:hypothetical protein AMTR_s00040p00068730 [Amborella trichopoda]